MKGKRIGVPGLNGVNHIVAMKWLENNGVDRKAVTYVETGFAQMGDLLKGGQVDVVVPVEDLSAIGEPTDDLTGAAAGAQRRASIWPHVEERVLDLDRRSALRAPGLGLGPLAELGFVELVSGLASGTNDDHTAAPLVADDARA